MAHDAWLASQETAASEAMWKKRCLISEAELKRLKATHEELKETVRVVKYMEANAIAGALARVCARVLMFACAGMHACACVQVCVPLPVYVCVYLCVRLRLCVIVRARARAYTCVRVRVYACARARVGVCMCVCACVWMLSYLPVHRRAA